MERQRKRPLARTSPGAGQLDTDRLARPRVRHTGRRRQAHADVLRSARWQAALATGRDDKGKGADP